MDFSQMLQDAVEKLKEWVHGFIVMLPNLVTAILILVVFWLLSRLAHKTVEKVLAKVHDTARNLLAKVALFGVLAAGVVIALGVLNLSGAVTSILAGVGIVGLALGFAFQDLAANFISGVGLSIRRVLSTGDIIETNDEMGIAEKIELRSTMMRTFQGDLVLIPNKEIYQAKVKIYGTRRQRRVDLPVGVSYGDDLEKVKRVTLEAVSGVEGRVEEREPELFYEEFGDSSINFNVRFWIHFAKWSDYLAAKSDAVMRIKRAYDDNDITIPFPIRTLDFGIKGGEKLDEVLPSGLSGARRGPGPIGPPS